MHLTYTLCFLIRDDRLLMLYRNKPPNQGLWNGVGGRIEPGEMPLHSCLREVHEETGYLLETAAFKGLLTWEGYEVEDGGLYIYTAQAPHDDFIKCDEGVLKWQPISWVVRSPEVVSNIHHFLPVVLGGAEPQVYHFVYQDGMIRHHELRPLPEEVCC